VVVIEGDPMMGVAAISGSTVAETVVAVVFVILGGLAAVFALYLVVLAVAALFYVTDESTSLTAAARLLVLIPAHDEVTLIGRCVRSLRAQTYPSTRYQVIVIADNCTDDTAAIALAAGADRVMIRDDPDIRGKGHALRWAIDRLLVDEPTAEAIVFVDADSTTPSDFLIRLVQRFQSGARAVQGAYALSWAGEVKTDLGVLAFLLTNRVRPAGRTVLRLGASHLAGNGMLLARDVLLEAPWTAFSSAEDLEYSLALHMAGIKIAFAGDAVLVAPPAPNAYAAAQQRLRWEGGKVHLARSWIPRLIGRAFHDRRPALLGTAFELALPPLGLLAAASLAGTVVGVCLAAPGLLNQWMIVPWLVALAAIPLFVVLGLRAGRVPASGYRALVGAPALILSKALRARRVLGFRGDTWVRTERTTTVPDDG
jgi:cellulose synthase/poly-beta-1,6-N-acetylglucosamine synthase-like glycosyltransferase